ncbi:hypothetical protein E2C01_073656 [Portunus trituberculatus]|uniref:Uncharacterized protein n=1 Tax=Portunus trituberculatus TaxID=210409 RepID=A0A5B7IA07_PORTR|nr:hypothetical protein [Portunus trituberculatus]
MRLRRSLGVPCILVSPLRLLLRQRATGTMRALGSKGSPSAPVRILSSVQV